MLTAEAGMPNLKFLFLNKPTRAESPQLNFVSPEICLLNEIVTLLGNVTL